MMRALHKYVGLPMAALLLVLTLSGAALSIFPALEKAQTPASPQPRTSVATLVALLAANYSEIEQIRRAPSGQIIVYHFTDDVPGATIVDPATGQGVAPYELSPTRRWLKEFHRTLFLGDGGRLVAATGALAMLVLSASGLLLVARRMGGWRRFFAPVRGTASARLHVQVGRLAAVGLLVASATALYMVLGTFELLPRDPASPPFPTEVSGETGANPAEMPALAETPLDQLRSLTFPYAGDPTDVFTLTTDRGTGHIDQGTGRMLNWENAGTWQKIAEFVYLLHTGQGAWAWGLILGAMVLGGSALTVTGVILWWRARRARPALPKGTVAAGRADTVILVGSEGGSTWGFAGTLTKGLMAHGHMVHVAPMSRFDPARYAAAEQIVVLAATYGDGEAPASAKGFLDRLEALEQPPRAKLAVLGFGDRQFPAYCAFARQVAERAGQKGWEQLVEFDTVDRQSPQDFARWGHALGRALGHDLELAHLPAQPRTHRLRLISRRDYGREVQAPTAILRFALPRVGLLDRLRGRGWPRFEPGDLLGIVPRGSDVARFYSLASGTRDGFVEICVRKHPHGLCSGQLFDLETGDEIHAFIRPNPEFRPVGKRKPTILIGAGTGIGPLAGFARANRGRPMYLYFGIRHPDSDFLYDREIRDWQSRGKLSEVRTAASRSGKAAYVQDLLREDGARLAELVRNGAQILVCGGRDMAAGVAQAMEEVLTPHGLEPALLKAEGRYLEDVY